MESTHLKSLTRWMPWLAVVVLSTVVLAVVRVAYELSGHR